MKKNTENSPKKKSQSPYLNAFVRSVMASDNIKAHKLLKKIVKNKFTKRVETVLGADE